MGDSGGEPWAGSGVHPQDPRESGSGLSAAGAAELGAAAAGLTPACNSAPFRFRALMWQALRLLRGGTIRETQAARGGGTPRRVGLGDTASVAPWCGCGSGVRAGVTAAVPHTACGQPRVASHGPVLPRCAP